VYLLFEDGLKPVIGMSFDCLESVEEFYKTYARQVGFSVRIGAQGKVLDVIENKRFLCSRQGFSNKYPKGLVAPSRSKKPKKRLEIICGWHALIYVKLVSNNRFYIASMVEHHNHCLVLHNKFLFLRSNHSISQRAKTTLLTRHKTIIRISQAYKILQVSDRFK
jgi:hypothetical protein